MHTYVCLRCFLVGAGLGGLISGLVVWLSVGLGP
jgi:hypothetical protein